MIAFGSVRIGDSERADCVIEGVLPAEIPANHPGIAPAQLSIEGQLLGVESPQAVRHLQSAHADRLRAVNIVFVVPFPAGPGAQDLRPAIGPAFIDDVRQQRETPECCLTSKQEV